MLFEPCLIVAGQFLLERRGIVPHGIEDAALAIHPALFALAEQPVKEAVGNHLGRQGAFITGPAHVALHAFAEGLLSDANLQRPEAAVAPDLGGDHLIDGGPGGSASREWRTRHQAGHGVGMAIALASGRRIVHPAEYVEVAPEGG